MAAACSEVKPLLRGQLHRISFFVYLILAVFIIYYTRPGIPRISMSVYLVTLINMYGISSVLHITDWKKPYLEARVQKIDHASIFLLISGTYTPICICCLPSEGWALGILVSVWVIAIAGVAKCLIWKNAPKAFNVAFYFVCGLTIIPFIPLILDYVSWKHIVMYIVGGAMYLIGGVIYGIEYPDPFPKVFGFHEIFHVLTILSNVCFLLPLCSCALA